MDKLEYRAVIKFLTLEGIAPKDIHDRLVNIYGSQAPSISTVQNWAKETRFLRPSIHDNPRSGRSKSATTEDFVARVHETVQEDRRLSVRQIAGIVGINYESTRQILLQDLLMKKVCARWVPKTLNVVQKRARVEICSELKERFDDDPADFVRRIITCDETWVHYYDPESRRGSMTWRHADSPPPQKARVQSRAGKIMATVFWDADGIIMTDYLERGKTVTGEYYATLLKKLREQIKEKRRGKLQRGVLLLQDNAPVHTCGVAKLAAADSGYELVPHPAYSPDLAPSDFYLFKFLKSYLKGTVFTDDSELQGAVNSWFLGQSGEFFSQAFVELEKRWTKCIRVNGDFVEM